MTAKTGHLRDLDRERRQARVHTHQHFGAYLTKAIQQPLHAKVRRAGRKHSAARRCAQHEHAGLRQVGQPRSDPLVDARQRV